MSETSLIDELRDELDKYESMNICIIDYKVEDESSDSWWLIIIATFILIILLVIFKLYR